MKIGPKKSIEDRVFELGEEGDKVRFHMRPPNQVDLFSLDEKDKRKNVDYVISKIKRIENLEYDDGTPVKPGSVGDIPAWLLVELTVEYTNWFLEVIETEKKTNTTKG